MAATSPAATVMLTPVIVISRSIDGLPMASCATSRSSTSRSSEPVEFADVPIDRRLLVGWKRLPRQPVPAAPVKEIRVRTARDQVRMQDRMHLVLDPGAMPDDLVPPRNQTTEPLRLGVRGPNFGQKAG